MRHSIIWRSSGFTIAFVSGHVFNYALLWGANRILDSSAFGLFYTVLLAISVAMSPILAVTLVMARRFAEISVKAGQQQVFGLSWRIIRVCIQTSPIIVAAGVVLAAALAWLGLQGWPIVLLVPIIVLALLILEIIRASLQSMLLFVRASGLWIAGTGTQCLFSLTALYFFASVSAGIAGLLAGAVLVALVCLPPFAAVARRQDATAIPNLHLRRELPMIISYSLFMLFNNIDLLLGYLTLPAQELGRYAASTLFPKAIIAATFAIAQVVLPVITEQRAGGSSFRFSAVKGIVMVAVAAGLAATVLRLAMPFIQSTPLAIRGLDFRLFGILAIAAVALSVVRVVVVIEVALQRFAIGFAQMGAIVLFVVLCTSSHAGATTIAVLYAITTSGFLLLCGGIFAASLIGRVRLRQ